MKRFVIKLVLLLAVFLVFGARNEVFAYGKFTISPDMDNPSVGDEFTVTIGVDSGDEISAAIDIFGIVTDPAKMEILSIDKAENPAFNFEMVPNDGYTETGKFSVACVSMDQTGIGDGTIEGDLITLTLKAKAAGWSSIIFDCTPNTTSDTNIFNNVGTDIVQCSLNEEGQYNIGGLIGDPTPVPPTSTLDEGSESTTTTTSGTTTTTSGTTTTSSGTTSYNDAGAGSSSGGTTSLPSAGSTEVTLGLIVFGGISLLSALFLRFL